VARIEKISVYNRFGSDQWKPGKKAFSELTDKSHHCYLFLLPSYFNHSCIPNAHRACYEDVLVVHASANVKKGEEINVTYTCPTDEYAERKKQLSFWDVECECRLCELDQEDGNTAKRAELLKELNDFIKLNENDPKAAVTNGEALLNQMREAYADRQDFKLDLVAMLHVLGMVYKKSGKTKKAIEYLEEALSLASDELSDVLLVPRITLNIALAYSDLGRTSKAQKMARRALTLSNCVDEEHFRLLYPTASKFSL